MTGLVAQFMVDPIAVHGLWRALLIIPLCLSISIVYKVTRLERLAELPAAAAALSLTIILGMYGVGFILWLLYLLLT